MRTSFIFKSLILIIYFNSLLFSDQIPSNNLSNYTLNRWIVVKDDGLNNDNLISEEDKILLYKLYLKLKKEFDEIDKNKL